MKKLLGTSALALVAMTGVAFAQTVVGQSVLERVLNSTNSSSLMPATGVFANIAENLPVVGTSGVTTYSDGTTTLNQTQYDNLLAQQTNQALADVAPVVDAASGATTGYKYTYLGGGTTTFATLAQAQAAAKADAADYAVNNGEGLLNGYTSNTVGGTQAILNKIDGSISNTMTGTQTATANVADSVTALQQVTVDIGNMATTVLGAVNTGTTSLGVNSKVAEAVAGASQAVNNATTQIGGAADMSALVLNVASNATDVLGNVNNSFSALNGTLGTISTTVLGSVNTGTITNGVNAATNGVVAGIVGTAP
ncbi:MAG: hypothetical protein GC186_08815 [Rhodobacteraceae bacterium]|nr:hypothetical protein [Paracoccaceae bacterium]